MARLLAFVLLSGLAAQDASEVGAVLRQGAGLISNGQAAAAQQLYEKALVRWPNHPDLTFELGMAHFRQRNWTKAAENFTASLSAKPGRVKPLFYLAEAYYMEADEGRALEAIREAARIAPDDPQVCQKYGEYLALGVETRREGLAWLEKARRLNPGLARIDSDAGMTQFALNDYRGAIASFEAALQKNGGDGQAAFLLAESWAKLNDWEKARRLYDSALERGYTTGAAYYGLGRARMEVGRYEEALEALSRGIALQPSLIQAHFQLARGYRQLGRTVEAQREIRLFSAMTDRVDTARELKGPEEEGAWKQVRVLVETGREQEALDALAKAYHARPADRNEPHYLLGVTYYGMDRKGDAIRMLRIARHGLPESARISAYLGFVELTAGHAGVAEQSLHTALALDSHEVLALIGLGRLRYEQKRWQEAVEYLERARPADPETLLILCDAYIKVRKSDEAELLAEVIRAFGSDKKPILQQLDSLVQGAVGVAPR
ncbi:MAG: tetratricopeptide repeat protein [Bryobacteraceae bacterium]